MLETFGTMTVTGRAFIRDQVLFMRASGKMDRGTEKELTSGHVEMFTKAALKKT
jgi:hypothetical protein